MFRQFGEDFHLDGTEQDLRGPESKTDLHDFSMERVRHGTHDAGMAMALQSPRVFPSGQSLRGMTHFDDAYFGPIPKGCRQHKEENWDELHPVRSGAKPIPVEYSAPACSRPRSRFESGIPSHRTLVTPPVAKKFESLEFKPAWSD